MDYIDPALHPPGERPDDVTERAEPIRPAAPPREEDPRAAHVRVQLELAIRQLNADIAQLEHERDGLNEEITAARLERDQLARLAALDPPMFEHLIAVLQLEGPAGDAPEDGYDEHLAEAMRNA